MIFEEKKVVSEKITKTSESILNLATALSDFQGEVKNAGNIAKGVYNKYAPLAEVLNVVRPVLAKHGLCAIQNTWNDGGVVYITTLVIHDSGEWLETNPLEMQLEKKTPQGVGSAITYGRRYSLSAALGLSSEEDDDGQSHEPTQASKKVKKNEPEDLTPKEDDSDEVKSAKELKAEIKQIDNYVKKLYAVETKKDKVTQIILKHNNNSKQYPKIQDIAIAKKIVEELEKLDKE